MFCKWYNAITSCPCLPAKYGLEMFTQSSNLTTSNISESTLKFKNMQTQFMQRFSWKRLRQVLEKKLQTVKHMPKVVMRIGFRSRHYTMHNVDQWSKEQSIVEAYVAKISQPFLTFITFLSCKNWTLSGLMLLMWLITHVNNHVMNSAISNGTLIKLASKELQPGVIITPGHQNHPEYHICLDNQGKSYRRVGHVSCDCNSPATEGVPWSISASVWTTCRRQARSKGWQQGLGTRTH